MYNQTDRRDWSHVSRIPVFITQHARARAQRRGVTAAAVMLAALHGYPQRRPGGAILRLLTHRSVAQAGRTLSLTPGEKDRLEGTAVLTIDEHGERVVVTVFLKRKQGRARFSDIKDPTPACVSERLLVKHA